MATLKEIKSRIASVRSTLKITSAMKMVSAAKLHKAQQAFESLSAYEFELNSILEELSLSKKSIYSKAINEEAPAAIVALSSNSSLCGAFNANAIKAAREAIEAQGRQAVLYLIGKKLSDSLLRDGLKSIRELNALSQHCSYEQAAQLADELIESFLEGKISRVELVWTHYHSMGKQINQSETFLPYSPVFKKQDWPAVEEKYILEPDKEALFEELLRKALRLRIYSLLIDNATAEHASRTVAMQSASDNAQNILSELTLEYNKSRQAKITAEILDLASGSQQ